MADIILSNIHKKFGNKTLFRDFSLKIERGEFLAIMGESGAGKTTLLNMMGLLERPDSGVVTICGQKNPAFSSHAAVELRRHHISYLFQNYGLIDTETVESNMRTATHFKQVSRKKERRLIAAALEQVGLQGYEQRKVYTLSGGEQQRVALAKVIAKSPQIIFADEPTGSLDERNRRSYSSMPSLSRNCATVMHFGCSISRLRKSLSPVRTMSTSDTIAAFKIGWSLASRISFSAWSTAGINS